PASRSPTNAPPASNSRSPKSSNSFAAASITSSMPARTDRNIASPFSAAPARLSRQSPKPCAPPAFLFAQSTSNPSRNALRSSTPLHLPARSPMQKTAFHGSACSAPHGAGCRSLTSTPSPATTTPQSSASPSPNSSAPARVSSRPKAKPQSTASRQQSTMHPPCAPQSPAFRSEPGSSTHGCVSAEKPAQTPPLAQTSPNSGAVSINFPAAPPISRAPLLKPLSALSRLSPILPWIVPAECSS